MVDFARYRRLFFAISAIVILVGLFSLAIPPRLKLGIEFSSGSTLTLRFEHPPSPEELRTFLRGLGYDVIVQKLGEGDYFIRTGQISREEKESIHNALKDRFGSVDILGFYNVSPIVAKETGRNAAIAIIAAAGGILLYIIWAFRRMPGAIKAGSCALIALAHDVLIVLGTFSILGRLLNLEVDALFITAILAIVGYSINNTVVVFDRLRENIGKQSRYIKLDNVVNRSLIETLARSLNTSITTLIILLALILLGGITTRKFILALTVGLVAGTYSSLFIAPMLWLSWQSPKHSSW